MPSRRRSPKKVDNFCWAKDFKPRRRAQFDTYELSNPEDSFVATSGNRIVGFARFGRLQGRHALISLSLMPEFRGEQSRALLVNAVRAEFERHPDVEAIYGTSGRHRVAAKERALARWYEMSGAERVDEPLFTHRIPRSKFLARHPPE